MLTDYIEKRMSQAKYEILEDGTYFGEIPALRGVWANNAKLEDCRKELKEVLEEWLILKIKDNDKIPGFAIPFSENFKMKYAC